VKAELQTFLSIWQRTDFDAHAGNQQRSFSSATSIGSVNDYAQSSGTKTCGIGLASHSTIRQSKDKLCGRGPSGFDCLIIRRIGSVTNG
jgi:hypothetical protein